ncbi:MAG: hypothetical protein JO286_03485 [Solirubrobacterales bacterium]|nr:hypothetical protein [Solirubrobacterales bacterium]
MRLRAKRSSTVLLALAIAPVASGVLAARAAAASPVAAADPVAAASPAAAADPAVVASPAVEASPVAAANPAVEASPAAGAVAPNQPVSELNVPNAACGVAGVVNKAIGIACGVLSNGGALLKGGKQLITGNVGGAVSTLLGGGSGTVGATASTALGLAAIGFWVTGGASEVLHETAAALGATTTPQLQSTWFSSTYWRMAAIAAMLTLPFLFAATVQALLRSDASLLARAALGYLPLAMISIGIVAPLATLLLSASDELCRLISSAAADEASHLIERLGLLVAGLTAFVRSPFLVFLIGLFTISATFALWIELLLREAAVYVVVLMLPLAFAALAWPARRIWAVRAVEILVALILSKFAIVAVLSLGGAAISAGTGHFGITQMMAGSVLILLSAFSPWALLRLVPIAEIASAAAGSLRREIHAVDMPAQRAAGLARSGDEWAKSTTAAMRRDAELGMDGGGVSAGGGLSAGGAVSAGRGGAERGRPAEGGAGAERGRPAEGGGGAERGRPAEGGGGAERGRPAEGGGGAENGGDAAPIPEPTAGSAGARRRWDDMAVLELGANFAGTPAWPHADAE